MGSRALITKTPLPNCGDVDLPTKTLELDSKTYELLGAKLQDDGAELFDVKKKALHSFYVERVGQETG